jgi:hypothetical protein
MSRPRVFVVNEPAKRDGSKTIDLSPACEHGELIFLSPAGDSTLDLEPTVERMTRLLSSFTEEDFLLPVGHPMLIALAGAIAARKVSRLQMLIWKGGLSRYIPIRANITWEPA